MHIAIEGMDGVGKTTAATKLAEILGFELVEKPLHYLFDDDGTTDNYIRIRNEMNCISDKRLTAWFYGLGNIYLYEKFAGKNIITDRHILSNYCWSGAQESDFIFDAIHQTVGNPDFTFLLYASPAAISARLKNRDKCDGDLKKVQFIPAAYDRMLSLMKKYQMPGLVIDTTDKNEEVVIHIMLKTLREKGLIDD